MPAWSAEGQSDSNSPASVDVSSDGAQGGQVLPEPAAAENKTLPLQDDQQANVDLNTPAEQVQTSGQVQIRDLSKSAPRLPASAKTFGNKKGSKKTLVVYDSTGDYAHLGEYYAMGSSTLATHYGTVTSVPVRDYKAGLAGRFNAVIYAGSTYNEELPRAFIDDVLTGNVPVLWSGFNIWQLAKTDADRQTFINRFGWDAATSYIDSTDTVESVTYKGRDLTRNALNTGGILSPKIVNADAVNVLASANCGTGGQAAACDQIAQSQGNSFPWAVRSSNLTYIGEIPMAYIDETDRYLAYADLILETLDPSGKLAKPAKAAVRIEDVSPGTSVDEVKPIIDYLVAEKIPFQIATIPFYSDPKGVENNGTPVHKKTFSDNPQLLALLKYARANGGTIVQHGTTHQYENLDNPYNGLTADDFEFYRSWCTKEASGGDPIACEDTSWVQLAGPVPADSVNWAVRRVREGRNELRRVGLGTPTIFETPHYAASDASYKGMAKLYKTRYERSLFFSGSLMPSMAGKGYFGQFFPYSVTDLYGTKVLPENLGNYEPEPFNNHGARSGADIVKNAQANTVVRDGNASFFFHPGMPVSELKIAVDGIRGAGFTFVSADKLN
ncbi:MAG: polysaccharide deacetylase family protein [Actinomycetaceae bacterium]|nr:polysaccharide deacetylase family protein [Actinomycetaceae bacterium]